MVLQMFSQISRIPDLIQKFWAKPCGVYAKVYGILNETAINSLQMYMYI